MYNIYLTIYNIYLTIYNLYPTIYKLYLNIYNLYLTLQLSLYLSTYIFIFLAFIFLLSILSVLASSYVYEDPYGYYSLSTDRPSWRPVSRSSCGVPPIKNGAAKLKKRGTRIRLLLSFEQKRQNIKPYQ